MALPHYRILNNELMNKDLDEVPKEAPLIMLDSKSSVFMANNDNYTKYTIQISRRMHFVRNGEE